LQKPEGIALDEYLAVFFGYSWQASLEHDQSLITRRIAKRSIVVAQDWRVSGSALSFAIAAESAKAADASHVITCDAV
jgi:hypothetical protein